MVKLFVVPAFMAHTMFLYETGLSGGTCTAIEHFVIFELGRECLQVSLA